MFIRKFLVMMCMIQFSIAPSYAQSHTIKRGSNNNSSTAPKSPSTNLSSSGKKTANSSSGKKKESTISSGKQKNNSYSAMKANPIASSCPDGNHPHAIDLGLPSGTKWACCNVGAEKPEAYGDYYAWGETREKTTYNWSTYIHCSGSESTCSNLGSDIAGTRYDVAYVKWGDAWMMPSSYQLVELYYNCTSVWTTIKGIEGRKFTGINGKVIFLPAAGRRWDTHLHSVGTRGSYWLSTQHPLLSFHVYYIDLYSYGAYLNDSYRSYGHSVRPVTR